MAGRHRGAPRHCHADRVGEPGLPSPKHIGVPLLIDEVGLAPPASRRRGIGRGGGRQGEARAGRTLGKRYCCLCRRAAGGPADHDSYGRGSSEPRQDGGGRGGAAARPMEGDPPTSGSHPEVLFGKAQGASAGLTGAEEREERGRGHEHEHALHTLHGARLSGVKKAAEHAAGILAQFYPVPYHNDAGPLVPGEKDRGRLTLGGLVSIRLPAASGNDSAPPRSAGYVDGVCRRRRGTRTPFPRSARCHESVRWHSRGSRRRITCLTAASHDQVRVLTAEANPLSTIGAAAVSLPSPLAPPRSRSLTHRGPRRAPSVSIVSVHPPGFHGA